MPLPKKKVKPSPVSRAIIDLRKQYAHQNQALNNAERLVRDKSLNAHERKTLQDAIQEARSARLRREELKRELQGIRKKIDYTSTNQAKTIRELQEFLKRNEKNLLPKQISFIKEELEHLKSLTRLPEKQKQFAKKMQEQERELLKRTKRITQTLEKPTTTALNKAIQFQERHARQLPDYEKSVLQHRIRLAEEELSKQRPRPSKQDALASLRRLAKPGTIKTPKTREDLQREQRIASEERERERLKRDEKKNK